MSAAGPVRPAEYDAFWLWAGAPPPVVLATARRVYLLYGQVSAREPVRLQAQRPATPRLRSAEVWMVVRVETLRWSPAIYAQLAAALARWGQAGTRLQGLQIDFDARTRHLAEYAAFLADLRRRLPRGLQLGVTGLLDWSANGDAAGLNALAGVVDEAVLQIYQGRRVIPGYARYLASLDRLRMPFRIGLLEGGEWRPPAGIERNARFRGYVVFLVGP